MILLGNILEGIELSGFGGNDDVIRYRFWFISFNYYIYNFNDSIFLFL